MVTRRVSEDGQYEHEAHTSGSYGIPEDPLARAACLYANQTLTQVRQRESLAAGTAKMLIGLWVVHKLFGARVPPKRPA